ncbi:hypothetical protein BKA56DRAFT_596460 [Ilyonectria sp. MPI-CAGE-AT-0026]|nr:hypothetical protein BKA56DRAFT_596460 [Ilyonectria sp. MPI-CAGE-AT-0026]
MGSITEINLAKRTFAVEVRDPWTGEAVSTTTYFFDNTLITFHLDSVGHDLHDAFERCYHPLLNAPSEDDHSNIASSFLSEIERRLKLSDNIPTNTRKEDRLWRIMQSTGEPPKKRLALLVLPPVTMRGLGEQVILEHLACLQQDWIPAPTISSSEQQKMFYCIASLHRMGYWSSHVGTEPIEDTMAKICSLIMGCKAPRPLPRWQQGKKYWLISAIGKVFNIHGLLRRLLSRALTPRFNSLLPSPSANSSTSLDADSTGQDEDDEIAAEKFGEEFDEEFNEKFDEKLCEEEG